MRRQQRRFQPKLRSTPGVHVPLERLLPVSYRGDFLSDSQRGLGVANFNGPQRPDLERFQMYRCSSIVAGVVASKAHGEAQTKMLPDSLPCGWLSPQQNRNVQGRQSPVRLPDFFGIYVNLGCANRMRSYPQR